MKSWGHRSHVGGNSRGQKLRDKLLDEVYDKRIERDNRKAARLRKLRKRLKHGNTKYRFDP